MNWQFWKNQKVANKSNNGILKDIFSGNIFQDKRFYKQIPFLATIILMMFFYIDNRYVCERQLEKISELEKQLVDREYQYLTISSLLIQSSQQSEVHEKVKKSNLNLNPLTSPAVEVKK
ncbi:MAG: hypothetical protein J6U44_04980 [Paludibacteraceae bacterium]|nr:hypothetical protein [Paludibacteraceae bacterium]MBO7316495.1 hypothetical protein [Paludibacteraceae bacterium]